MLVSLELDSPRMVLVRSVVLLEPTGAAILVPVIIGQGNDA